MGFLFDEKDFIESNIYLHESRMESQYSRFLDSTPTFATYYRINNVESTADRGFLNVERVLGSNSPIRFNEVSRLPMYKVDQIVLDLQMEDQGLDTSYEGSAVLLPNTVIPRPNDYFIIDHLGKNIVFMVTSIAYDTIRSNNFYEIQFKVKYVDDGSAYKSIQKQTVDKFTCYYENVGTEDKVLVRTLDSEIIAKLNKITTDIANYYRALFFDSRYNSFLFNRSDGYRVYDRVLTRFINKNRIFSDRKGYDTIYLSDEDKSVTTELEYHNSIFRAIEKRDPSLLKDVKYIESFVFEIASVFTRWRDGKIISIIQGAGIPYYIRPELLEFFRNAVNMFGDEGVPEDYPSNQDPLNELQPTDTSIVIPDENLRPTYIEDQNIFFKNNITEEVIENIVETPTSETDGSLDLDSLFSEETTDGTNTISEPITSLPEEPAQGTEPIVDSVVDSVSTENVSEVSNQDNMVDGELIDNVNTYTFEVEKFVPQYLQTPDNYNQENIMTTIIAKYFSGKDLSLYELNIEELAEHVSYIDMNSRETFILVPIFLYVLEQYFMKHLAN